MSWSHKFFLEVMFSYHMANILAKKTFNTFPELLDPVNITLVHSPRPIGRIRGPGLEPLYFLFDFKVDGYIRYQVSNYRKGSHRLNVNGLTFWQVTHAGHTHQPRATVDFGRT